MVRKTRSGVGVLAASGIVAVVVLGSSTAMATEKLDQMVAQRMDMNDAGGQTQQQVDNLSDQADTLAGEYRAVRARIEALRIYNRKVDKLIVSQQEEMVSLRRQIDDVELIGREVTPLMLAMLDAIENFVELDIPFLAEERATRIEGLHDIMGNSNVTDAERYRRIMEAYQIENEYGRTIEAYSAELNSGGQSRQVDFLRIGRVSLLYQTLDGLETGVWDQKTQSWSLAPDYRVSVRQGLRMARKQAAPDLLRLPVPAAEAAK